MLCCLMVLLEVELQSKRSVGFPLRALLGGCHSSPSCCSVRLWECCLNFVSHPEEPDINEAMGVSRTKKTKDSSSRWAPWWGLGFYVIVTSSSGQLINCPFGECFCCYFLSSKVMQCSCMVGYCHQSVCRGWPLWDKLAIILRKQKSKLEKGQGMPKTTQVKEQPEEIPCMGQVLNSLFYTWAVEMILVCALVFHRH